MTGPSIPAAFVSATAVASARTTRRDHTIGDEQPVHVARDHRPRDAVGRFRVTAVTAIPS